MLIHALSEAGCSVLASPQAVAGDFSNWYAGGCQSVLAKMDVFVAVVSQAWGSSTWMAIEADAARNCVDRVGLRCFAWNPQVQDVPQGLRPYAEPMLSPSLPEAVRTLLSSVLPPRPKVVDKVLMYIVSEDHILKLTHPESTDAGRQVPGGTVEPGETMKHAALREASRACEDRGHLLAPPGTGSLYRIRPHSVRAHMGAAGSCPSGLADGCIPSSVTADFWIGGTSSSECYVIRVGDSSRPLVSGPHPYPHSMFRWSEHAALP